MFRRRARGTAADVTPGRLAANARLVTHVEFVGDPVNEARTAGLMRDVLTRAQGGGQLVYRGMDGDPSNSFTGYGPQLQRFAGAAAPAHTASIFRDPMQATMENGLRDGQGPYEDPIRRVLAERLRRRR